MDQETHDAIELGRAVDAFICSKLGKHLLDKADQDRARAMVKLGEANPTDAATIARIQQDYNTPNKVMMWLLSAKEEGIAKSEESAANKEANEEVSQTQ